jgi:hypothetical protein
MDFIARAVTTLLGIASYFVQANISQDAERMQKDSDRERADNARADGKAEMLLARVGRASTARLMHLQCRVHFATRSRVQ